jgi:membrane-associated PAP2 superfamily phosphatase
LIILIYNSINKDSPFKKYHRQILIFFLGIVLIPLIAGNIKKFTNIYCPNQLEIYNGKYPYVKVLEPYPAGFKQTKKGQCFPAGHAVTGFCLMILFFVFEKKRWKWAGLLLGLVLGWILGTYQMLKGAHFIGDTLVAMFCCFLIATLIARVVGDN